MMNISNLFSSMLTSVMALVCFPIALACARQICRALKYAIAAYSEHRISFAMGKMVRIVLFFCLMKVALSQVVKFPLLGGFVAFAICIAFAMAVVKILRGIA